jgi:ATP-dependent DNA helicase PIF1
MELSKEQQIAFDIYKRRENLFLTGPGGSGKSALIKKIYEDAYERFQNIHVCAMTGCAAVLLNCNAKTLHSWAGIGLGNGTLCDIIDKIKKSRNAKERWKETDILVVDEVSMLSKKLFNLLNALGQAIRRNNRPFGGIQIIFSGDFFQLPPVGDREEPETQRFCFESEDWNTVFSRDNQIHLVKIFRQKDELFSTILSQIRQGKIKRRTNDLLMEYVGRERDPALIAEPTKLFPTRRQVDSINLSKMAALEGEVKIFCIERHEDLEMTKKETAIRKQFTNQDIQIELDFLTNNVICDKKIILKPGCQVMCIINITEEIGISKTKDSLLLCNGSQGIIMDFCPLTESPIVKFNNGVTRTMTPHIWQSDKIPGIGISQIPLILAWALTIHKSQGSTMDAAEIDAGSGIFECGQTYVALSRVKSLEGLYLASFDAKKIMIHNKAQEYYDALTLFHERKKEPELVVAVPVPKNDVSFSQFNYVEAKAELITDKYDD